MTTASSEKLGKLHGKLADVLTEYMEDIDVSDTESLGSNVQVMKLVSSFLKENNITADLRDEAGEDAVTLRLQELHKKRRVTTTPLDNLN
jgi:hypothetical protein